MKRNLEQNYSWYGQPDILIQALTANSFDTDNFNQAMVKFRDQGILPIICLDKIETLLKHPNEFKDDFFDNLRFLMGLNSLMLVIASEKNIKIYRDQKKLTSTFFNDAQTIILNGLTENEARDLVRLPQTTIPNTQAALNDLQQKVALDWGGKNPYLLQLAGLYLWEARENNKTRAWARKKFDNNLSRTVQSADMATSAYRKVEILQRPIDSLTQMQTSFAFLKNPRIANLSGQIAQKWLSIIQTAKSDFKKQPHYLQEIPQVYIAGPALNPEDAQTRFKGRKDLFREIEKIALMSPPPTLLLYGGRRTGKTSTLNYLPQKVGGDLIPLMVDLQGAASAETSYGVAKFIVRQIIESARKSRNLTLNPPSQEDLRADPFFTLQEWFIDLEERIPGKKFLLCLDEYELLEKVVTATNSRASLNFLRHIIQHRPAWILLFSGSHTLDEIAEYWSDYLISTRYVRITFLEKPEAVELITHPTPDFPDIYLPEAVERIIYWTNCQPYLVQLLCSELVDYLNRKYPQNNLQVKATAQDINNIIPKALEVGRAYFNEFWDNSLNAPEREFIRNLINNAAPMDQAPVVGNKLIDKDILKLDDNNQVHFRVPLIERSFIQKIEQES